MSITYMEEISVRQSPPPPQPPAAASTDSGGTASSRARKRPQEGSSPSALSRAKKDCASFTVSLQEGFRYVKALLLGQVKKMTARTEREAMEADMQTYKMQVDAADAAEDAKKKLDKTA